MRFSMTLGKKIGVGVALPLLLMIAVGAAGYFGLNRMMAVIGFYQEINEIRAVLSSAKRHTDRFLMACAMGKTEEQQKLSGAVHKDTKQEN